VLRGLRRRQLRLVDDEHQRVLPGTRQGLGAGSERRGGGGNIGVPVIQLVALLVIATAGAGYPRIILTVYIPLIVVAAVLAALNMDNISSVRNDTGAFQESIREHHTWIMAFLYIGTSARSSATASPSVSCCRTSSAAPRCRPRPSPSSGRCSGP
jgi:hypothetical protein